MTSSTPIVSGSAPKWRKQRGRQRRILRLLGGALVAGLYRSRDGVWFTYLYIEGVVVYRDRILVDRATHNPLNEETAIGEATRLVRGALEARRAQGVQANELLLALMPKG